MEKYYLAYGSNLNKEQMAVRCPDAEAVGTARIRDYELLFKGSRTGAYLTIEPKKGKSVPVGVWKVTEEDERKLDFYEGYPNFYYKKELPVVVKRDGKNELKNCFIYIMHENRKKGVPTSWYVNVCIQGYYDFGFSPEELVETYRKSKTEGTK